MALTLGTSALHRWEDKNNSIDELDALSLGKTEPRAVVFSFSQEHKMLFYVSDLSYLSDSEFYLALVLPFGFPALGNLCALFESTSACEQYLRSYVVFG